jgi:hypothetical protein
MDKKYYLRKSGKPVDVSTVDATDGHVTVLIWYSPSEMRNRRNRSKCAHVQRVRKDSLVEHPT